MSTGHSFAKLKVMKAKEILELEAQNGKWSHAYLLVGANHLLRDELIAYIIEQKKCLKTDISSVKPENVAGKAGEIKIDDIRDLLHQVYLSPQGKSRIAIIYNCEKLNSSSGNILLKSLEEPPSYLTYILTCDYDSVLPTIRSRCRILNIAQDYRDTDKSEQKYIGILNKGFFEASTFIDELTKKEEGIDFLAEIEAYFRRKMLEAKNKTTLLALQEIQKVKKELKTNANQRLALECLFLKLRKLI